MRNPPALLALIISLAVALAPAAIATTTGCAGPQLAGARAAAVDCTTAEIGNLVAEFGPAVGALVSKARDGSGSIDTAALKQSAASLGVRAGACVLAEVLASASSGKRTLAGDGQLPLAPDVARRSFATVRDQLWPGTQYFSSMGAL